MYSFEEKLLENYIEQKVHQVKAYKKNLNVKVYKSEYRI